MDLPWHQQVWQRLLKSRGRLPHALLIAGQAGLGKRRFALRLAKALLCEQSDPNGDACGECDACHQFEAGSHPDFFPVSIPEDKTRIGIDQIRRLIEQLGLRSQRHYRVAVIEPADAMTHEAMNSLLKVLEEPGEDTLIILVSSRPGFLPATIRSRCQRHDIAPPTMEAAQSWLLGQGVRDPLPLLAMANGSPLAALALRERDIAGLRVALMQDIENLFTGKENPVALAEKWSSDDPALAIDWLSGCIMDMIRLKMGPNPPGITNPDLLNNLKPLAKQLDLDILYRHLEQVGKARNLLQGSVSNQVILEEVLIPWFRGLRRRA